MKNSYIEQVKNFLDLFGCITHKDILRITDCNCPYSTLRDVRKKIELVEEWATDPETKKRFKVYKVA
jgi:hypothetical protein